MSKKRQGKPIGQTMVEDRRRNRLDRQRKKRLWSLQPGGDDLDALASAHGLSLKRTRGGISVMIMRGAWIAGHYFASTRALTFDGGHTIEVTGLEQAITATADALRLD